MNNTNSSIDVVVAKYREDVSWTKNLKYPVYIYDKSGTPNEEFVKLPNLGREAHTYLYHIVTHYDTLADYTIFLQGNPYDHAYKIPESTNEKCAEYINNLTFPLQFQGFYQDFKNFDSKYEDLAIMSVLVNKRKIFTKEMNIHQEFAAGAQYIVPKENLLAKPLAFYTKLLYMSAVNQQFVDSDDLICPWTLERMWPFVFDPTIEVNPSFLS